MHYEYLASLDVTYGNALAGGGGYHRVTTMQGAAAEITPNTYLWYKITTLATDLPGSAKASSSATKSSSIAATLTTLTGASASDTPAIVELRVWSAEATSPIKVKLLKEGWTKVDKALDREQGLFLWYRSILWSAEAAQKAQERALTLSSSFVASSSSAKSSLPLFPLKELRIVRQLDALPKDYEYLSDPIVTHKNQEEIRSFICYRRLSMEDLSNTKWSIHNQQVGNWLDVREMSRSSKWSIGQIASLSSHEIRLHVLTWTKTREEILARGSLGPNRVAKLNTYTNLQLSPSYPFACKQGVLWGNVNTASGTPNLQSTTTAAIVQEIESVRRDVDQKFLQVESNRVYFSQTLVPFIEKTLTSMLTTNEQVERVQTLHQQVLKRVVSCLVSANAGANLLQEDNEDGVLYALLALLRMILNGHAPCIYFYLKNLGNYTSLKAQKLVYTSFLVSAEAVASLSARHPCRSLLFVESLDVFFQAGGFAAILQRIQRREISLTELNVYCSILVTAKPCLVVCQKRSKLLNQKKTTSTTRTALNALASVATGGGGASSASISASASSSSSAIDSQVEDFFKEFMNACFARLRRMTHEELKDEDGLIEHLVRNLDLLYGDGLLTGELDTLGNEGGEETATDASDASSVFAETIEVFHLDLAKMFICCPFLSQRLLGLNRMNELIGMAIRRDGLYKRTILKRGSSTTDQSMATSTASLGSRNDGNNTSVARWLRTRYVVEWLATSDVLEVLLGDAESCHKYGLNEGSHLEILKRSKSLLDFCACNNLFCEKHVALLWHTAMNHLQTGRKTVLDLLLALCPVLTADVFDVLMGLMIQVPIAEYDDLFVNFVKRVISIAAKLMNDLGQGKKRSLASSFLGSAPGSSGPGSSRNLNAAAARDQETLQKIVSLGCCLLWNGLTDQDQQTSSESRDSIESSLTGRVSSSMEVALAESLNIIQNSGKNSSSSSILATKPPAPMDSSTSSLLDEYLEKCAANIQQGKQVEISMALIQRIADSFASSSSSASSSGLGKSGSGRNVSAQHLASSRSLILDLDRRFQIINVVVDELSKYMNQRGQPSSTKTSAAALEDLARIETRLNFLGYLATKSSMELTFSDVCRVWRCFADTKASVEATEVFFKWLTSVVADPSDASRRVYSTENALSMDTTSQIFDSLLRNATSKSISGRTTGEEIVLDIKTMGVQAFWCLEKLFRCVNTLHRLMSWSNDGQQFQVENTQLRGLDTMYQVALCAHEEVSEQAINYLIYLQLHLGSKLVRREVWSDFVCNCLERLEPYTSGAGASPGAKPAKLDSSKTQEVRRLLLLLGTFLHQSSQMHLSDFENGFMGTLGGGVGGGGLDAVEELVVYVKTQDGRAAAPFRYHLRKTCTVAELRDKIAKDTNHPAERVRLLNEFKVKLTAQGHDKFTLEKARVFAGSAAPTSTGKASAVTAPAPAGVMAPSSALGKRSRNCVEAILLSRVESDTVGHIDRTVVNIAGSVQGGIDGDWIQAKKVISEDSRRLGQLFGLLSTKDGVCEEAWKVLKQVDCDQNMEKTMRTLNNCLAIDGSVRQFPKVFHWNQLLDAVCPPKLLYQLELLEEFAFEQDPNAGKHTNGLDSPSKSGTNAAQEEPIGVANSWSVSFLKLNGKRHLEEVILAINPKQLLAQGPLAVLCLAKVLKVLRHFVLVETQLEQEEAEEAEDNDEMDDRARREQRRAKHKDAQKLFVQLIDVLHSIQSVQEESKAAAVATALTTASETTTNADSVSSGMRFFSYTRAPIESHDNQLKLPSEAFLITRVLAFVSSLLLCCSDESVLLLESHPRSGPVFLHNLVTNPFKPVRQEAVRTIAALCTTTSADAEEEQIDRGKCRDFFLKLLGDYDGTVADEEYYQLFILLVSKAQDLTHFDFIASCRILCQRLRRFDEDFAACRAGQQHQHQRGHGIDQAATAIRLAEDATVSSPRDVLLEALLSTLLTILQKIPPILAGKLDVPYRGRSLREVISCTLFEQDNVMEELFTNCLFATATSPGTSLSDSLSLSMGPSKPRTTSGSENSIVASGYFLSQPKCRSDRSRELAFALLSELAVENTPGLQYLLVLMGQQHSLQAPAELGATSAKLTTSNSTITLKKKRQKAKEHTVLERGKYVGLKNLGCTCYLNSTLQAFFMTKRFRRDVLRFDSNPKHSGLLWELQSLFAHLEGTAKPYYNPKAFTSAFKTWDGESLDVNQQQDASEFLTSFFQQIESEVNGIGEAHDNLLNRSFGGVFSNELVAEGGRYSERCEPFHFISVPVRDRKNLEESLDGWIEGEKVSYTWEADQDHAQEKATLETRKRICIAQLPEFLIVHLKRFEFDFETMQQNKVHDRFEFPMELNMFPYTKQGRQSQETAGGMGDTTTRDDGEGGSEYFEETGAVSSPDRADAGTGSGAAGGSNPPHSSSLAPEYFEYELVGTVVHMGTAHSGHYYSFLRDQDDMEQDGADTQQRWYEFNDTIITPFDVNQIPEECFGGEEDSTTGGGGSSSNNKKNLTGNSSNSITSTGSSSCCSMSFKNRSSFMLFYARKKPKLSFAPGIPEASLTRNTKWKAEMFRIDALVLAFVSKLLRRSRARRNQVLKKSRIIAPEPIRSMIVHENFHFWRKKYLYDEKYLNFTYELIKSCLNGGANGAVPQFDVPEVRLEALQMATRFVFGTLWQGGNIERVLEWRIPFQALYHDETDGCKWLLTTLSENKTLIMDLLVFNSYEEVRELMAMVLSDAISMTSHFEQEEPSSSPQQQNSGTRRPKHGEDNAEEDESGGMALPVAFDFVFVLIQLMPRLLDAPVSHHAQYFTVLLEFAHMGRNECLFLVVNGVIGVIVGLLTELGHTQPLIQEELQRRLKTKKTSCKEASNPLTSSSSSSKHPSSIAEPTPVSLKAIELNASLLKLLSLLLRCGKPPAMDVKNPQRPSNIMQDCVDLSEFDTHVLLHERFVLLLLQRANHYTKETKPLEQILQHLCWESHRMTDLCMQLITKGLEQADHLEVKCLFRSMNTLLKIRDSLMAQRLEDGMTSLLAVVSSQQKYFKATECSIDMLTRLAKRHPNVIKWLRQHEMSCAWMEKWLLAHRSPDGLLQQQRTQLVKPNSSSSWQNVSATNPSAMKSVDRSIARLLPRLRSILHDDDETGQGMEAFYDSDENPQRLVGKRVCVKWAKDKWYEGTVQNFNEQTYQHFVVYDDGDKREYRMAEKIFYVVDRPPVAAPASSQ